MKSARSEALRTIVRAIPGAPVVVGSSAVKAIRASWRRYGIVRQPLRFTAFEILGARGRLGTYTLANSTVAVVLRHRTRDLDIFEEIFVGARSYEAPASIRKILGSKPLHVLDLGGNIGLYGAFALSEYDVASMTTFEPDPSNLPVLRRCLASNPDRPWQLIEACAARHDGRTPFLGGKYADSHVSFDATEATLEVPTVDVLPYMVEADLVKIDIEGSEWEILADRRLADIGATVIVMEWHARNSPSSGPYRAAMEMLQAAEFNVEGIDHGYSHGTIWAWKDPQVGLPPRG